jgi:hypothetical protein
MVKVVDYSALLVAAWKSMRRPSDLHLADFAMNPSPRARRERGSGGAGTMAEP